MLDAESQHCLPELTEIDASQHYHSINKKPELANLCKVMYAPSTRRDAKLNKRSLRADWDLKTSMLQWSHTKRF